MDTNGLGGLDVKLFYPKPLSKDFYIHYYKLFVFDDYFKQWDWIFHVDLDVIFNEEIDLKLSDRDVNTLYAKDDGLSLYQQFARVKVQFLLRPLHISSKHFLTLQWCS